MIGARTVVVDDATSARPRGEVAQKAERSAIVVRRTAAATGIRDANEAFIAVVFGHTLRTATRGTVTDPRRGTVERVGACLVRPAALVDAIGGPRAIAGGHALDAVTGDGVAGFETADVLAVGGARASYTVDAAGTFAAFAVAAVRVEQTFDAKLVQRIAHEASIEAVLVLGAVDGRKGAAAAAIASAAPDAIATSAVGGAASAIPAARGVAVAAARAWFAARTSSAIGP